MTQLIFFIVIYTIMIFIWSIVYINTNSENKRINRSFLLFISLILVWMFFDTGNLYSNHQTANIIIKSAYFISMLSMSVFFLNFIYQLIKRKYDILFYIALGINTLTIIARYMYPIDYSVDNFWQLFDPIIAPIMATLFSLPMILSLYLIIKYYIKSKDIKLKKQLKNITIGIGMATIISIISEYILPAWLGVKLDISLMYLAILTLVAFLYFAIIRNKFLNVQVEFIYNNLFINSSEAMVLIDNSLVILNINEAAKKILTNRESIHLTKINEYIKDYDFTTNYKQHETSLHSNKQKCYVVISQYPIDNASKNESKLLHITDVTENKLKTRTEKEELVKKTYIDQLTGLYNKRYINENYKDKTIENNTTVIFIDIDDFKSINDVYGHVIGDKALQKVSQDIKSSTRPDEIAIRYGGDEFMLILENTTTKNAYIIAERIRKKVNNADLLQDGSLKKMSLSIGIGSGIGNIYDIIRKADIAMYKSKDNGKNQINIY